MSTTPHGYAAYPSAGVILPKQEAETDFEPQQELGPEPFEEQNVSSDAPSAPERPVTPPKAPAPTFYDTLPAWVMAFRPEKERPKGMFVLKWWWFWAKWWMYVRPWPHFYKIEWIKPPSMQSRKDMWAEIFENEKYTNSHRRITFTAGNSSVGGGSSKTTVMDTLAAYFSALFRSGVALLGLDIGADKTASRFHVKEENLLATTTLVSSMEKGMRFYPRDLVHHTDSDAESGLVLFKAKNEDDLGTLDYTSEQSSKLLKYMVRLYPVLFCDGGPGLTLMTTNGIMEASDIIILPKKGISDEATTDIRKVIQHPPFALQDRIDRIIVVISAVTKRQLNTRTQYIVAEKCGVAPEHVVLIPYDRYLDDQVMVNLKRVSIPALSLKTRLMYSRLMKLNVQIAETFN